MPPEPPHILWAEDGAGDRLLISAALAELDRPPRVHFVEDGAVFAEELPRLRPKVAVLDLRMPRIGGLEALRTLRRDPTYAGLPVLVFSAGEQPHETAECQALGALAVVHKPVDFRAFTVAVHRLVELARPHLGSAPRTQGPRT